MRSPGINGEGELRGQLANPGSPGKKWPLKWSVVQIQVPVWYHFVRNIFLLQYEHVICACYVCISFFVRNVEHSYCKCRLTWREFVSMDVRPNHTIYINNLNEKIKKDGMCFCAFIVYWLTYIVHVSLQSL